MSERKPRTSLAREPEDRERSITSGPTIGRRRLLGGALAGALAAVLLDGELRPAPPGPNRWKGKTRWIGHC